MLHRHIRMTGELGPDSLEIGREASQISSSPRTNVLNPPPVPDLSTLSATSAWALLNSCATAWLSLKTVLEPSISILAPGSW